METAVLDQAVKAVADREGKVPDFCPGRRGVRNRHPERTCIIVVEVKGASQTILMGIVVDSVSEVLNIKGTDIEDTPNFGTNLNTAFILGMAKTNGSVKILLDIDRIFREEEMAALAQAS